MERGNCFAVGEFQKIMELGDQKNDLIANPVVPAIDHEEKVRLADVAKNWRIRAEAGI